MEPAACDAQLAVQVGQVGLDRALLHEQLGRDPGVAASGRQQPWDLQLPLGQRLDQRRQLLPLQAQPYARARNVAASSTLKPRSAARTSESWVAGAQPRQGQRGVLAAGDHQMQRRWQVLEQDGDRLVHGLGAHGVGRQPGR